MHKLYELKDKLIKELEDYSDNGKFSKDDVEAIKYTASAIDHICNIMERADEEAYSMANDGYYVRTGNPYSYARGRRIAKRDSMGRYSSRGYSMDDGTIEDLKEIMANAKNEHVRKEIQDVIRRVESMM